jgi:hypothetical protein
LRLHRQKLRQRKKQRLRTQSSARPRSSRRISVRGKQTNNADLRIGRLPGRPSRTPLKPTPPTPALQLNPRCPVEFKASSLFQASDVIAPEVRTDPKRPTQDHVKDGEKAKRKAKGQRRKERRQMEREAEAEKKRLR